MIDFHMLLTDRLPDGWQQQAIDSVHAAIERSPVPVVFHTLPESEGKFWEARWDGYQLGNNPWVSYLDADDWVEPSLFGVVAPSLSSSYDVISTKGWDHIVYNGKESPSNRGLRFFRRELVVKADRQNTHECCPSCSMFYQSDNKLTLEDRLVHLRVGYTSLATKWRRGNGVG